MWGCVSYGRTLKVCMRGWGRPSIPPERLLRALLLQVLYSIRSERQLMEQLDYNLLFRWFVGLNPDDEIWDATVFGKNRDRMLAGEVSQRLLEAVLKQAGEHQFVVERGTLHGGWHADRSLGEPQEFRAQGQAAEEGHRLAGGRSCCGTRTSRRPIRRRGCTGRAMRENRGPATWGMC